MKEITPFATKYNQEILPQWKKDHGVTSEHGVPKITKVVINMGLGMYKENEGMVESAAEQIERIAGQKPVITRAKKSIAGFNVREGMPVGVKVTLRGQRMYQFLEKIFNFVLPRTRDFRGLPNTGFDGYGNYSFGMDDQLVFLEIDPNQVGRRLGLQVTITTTADNNEDAEALLRAFGAPIQTKEETE